MPKIKKPKLDPTQTATATASHPRDKAQDEHGNQAVAWQARKKGLERAILKANKEIHKLDSSLTNFFKGFIDLPANIRVKINNMNAASGVKIDTLHSRIASFNGLLLDYLHQHAKTPEIQTAIIEERGSHSFKLGLSGNNKKANKTLTKMFQGKEVKDVYAEYLRPIQVRNAENLLEKTVGKMSATKLSALSVFDAPVKDYSYDSGFYVHPKDSGMRLEEDEFIQTLNWSALIDAHEKTIEDPQRRKRRRARAFAKKPLKFEKKAVSTKGLMIPENKEEHHAESAILKKTEELGEIIRLVGGTKTACTSCQAVFTKAGKETLLSDRTSFAWLSESSMTQLGITVGQIEDYLLELQKVLQPRLDKLQFYEGRSGTYLDDDLAVESDTNDSEDEDAVYNKIPDDLISERVFEMVKRKLKKRPPPTSDPLTLSDVDD